MSTPLKDKLRAAAASYAALTSILGNSPFRWYDLQLVQGSAFPAAVVQIVSTTHMYTYDARPMNPVRKRVQFTLWGGSSGSDAATQLQQALYQFLDQFNAVGIGGLPLYPNQVINARDGFYAQTQPGIYQILVDAWIWDNENL